MYIVQGENPPLTQDEFESNWVGGGRVKWILKIRFTLEFELLIVYF